MPLSGLPAKKLVVSCARFCALARSAIWSKRGRPAHLAQVEDCKSDMNDRCFGGLFSRGHGSGQPTRWWAGSSAGLPAACARPYLQPGGARLSVGPGICGTSRVTPCVSLLGPYPNSAALARLPTSQECGPPASTRRLAAFSGLPARPQLAPAAHGVGRPGTGIARFSPGGGPPRQHPAVGVRGSIPRVGSPRQGGTPLLQRGFGLALRTLAASPPRPLPPPTPRRRRQLRRRRR